MASEQSNPKGAPIISREEVDSLFAQWAENDRRAAENPPSDKLPDHLQALFDGEVQRLVAFRKSLRAAIDNDHDLSVLGVNERRHGTRIVVDPSYELPSTAEGAFLAFKRPQIKAEVDKQLGNPLPTTIDDFLVALRQEADETYQAYGLPTGATRYWRKRKTNDNDWASWQGGYAGVGDDPAQIVAACQLATIANLGADHPVTHAGRLHSCTMSLQSEALKTPVDVFGLVSWAMAAQSAADTLHAVTTKRRASGLTDAEAVFRGEKAKKRADALTSDAASKRRKARQPTLDAAKRILEQAGNRNMSMTALINELAAQDFVHDTKALTTWIVKADLMVPRGANKQGYKPNPELFAKKIRG
jgi:hypothetical protein